MIAPSFGEVVIGRYNQSYNPVSSTQWNSGDRIFTIGNGTSGNAESNAVTILKNGNIGFGTDTPTEKLEVNGKTKTTQFQMTNGANDDYILKSDANGNATWSSLSFGSGLTTNYLTKWTGTDFTSSIIYNGTSGIGVNTSSIPTESTLVLGGSATTEGGQLQLNSAADKSTAYFIDNYNNSFRILNGSNTASLATRMMIDNSGNVGIAHSNPNATLDINGTIGMKIKSNQQIGTNNPDNSASIWQYTSAASTSSTITLPTASTCTNRCYTIINTTSSVRNISFFYDLGSIGTSTIAAKTSITLISDGTNWVQVK